MLEPTFNHVTHTIVHKLVTGLNGPGGIPALLHAVQAPVDEYVDVKVHTMVANLVREKITWSKSVPLVHVLVMS